MAAAKNVRGNIRNLNDRASLEIKSDYFKFFWQDIMFLLRGDTYDIVYDSVYDLNRFLVYLCITIVPQIVRQIVHRIRIRQLWPIVFT
jgi:hypothetical protein